MALFGKPSARDDQRAMEYRQWVQQRHPLAIASMVLGVFSLIEFGLLFVLGVAGIVMGVMALVQLRRQELAGAGNPDLVPQRGHRLAWTGIIASAVSLIIATIFYSGVLH